MSTRPSFRLATRSKEWKRRTGSSFVDTLLGDALANEFHGNAGDDIIRGFAGNDKLYGDAGADKISSGLGRDVMYGGAGADTFIFNSLADSTLAQAGRDFILDFTHLSDKVDLSVIDSNALLAGNQAFAYIGTAAFTGVAGQLHYAVLANGYTFVSGDVNGDSIADFGFNLKGTALSLSAADFIL